MKKLISSMSVLAICSMPQLSNAGAFSLELDVNTGVNNNVFLESDDLVINEATEDSDKKDIQTQIAVTAHYEFWDKESSDASVLVDYFKESLRDNDMDTQVTSFSLPMHYYNGDYRYGLTLSRQSYDLSGVDVLQYGTAKLGLAKTLGEDKIYVSLSNTNKTPKDDSYAEYDGTSRAISVKYKNKVDNKNWTFQVNGFNNEYLGEGLSNKGVYVRTSYEIHHGRHITSLSAKWKGTAYEEDTLFIESRTDRQISMNVNYEYYVSRYVQLYLDTNYINNKSNIDYADESYTYDQMVNTLGARFIF